MIDDVIVEGLPDSPFYTDKKSRDKIDAAMKETVILMTKKGTRQLKLPNGDYVDDLPEKERNEWYEDKEVEILLNVRPIDPQFVDSLIPENY